MWYWSVLYPYWFQWGFSNTFSRMVLHIIFEPKESPVLHFNGILEFLLFPCCGINYRFVKGFLCTPPPHLSSEARTYHLIEELKELKWRKIGHFKSKAMWRIFLPWWDGRRSKTLSQWPHPPAGSNRFAKASFFLCPLAWQVLCILFVCKWMAVYCVPEDRVLMNICFLLWGLS